jgi:hypothetical protein
MTNKNRTCKLCNEFKDMSHFQPNGYQCRECRNEKQRAYWAALPEEVRIERRNNGEYQRRYRANNPEKVKAMSRKTHIMRKFGMTTEEYENLLLVQNGVCAICENPCETGMNLAVDHNHTTGKIRALLCKNCNTAIGLLKENTDTMTKAINYLQFHSMVDASSKVEVA